MMKFRLVDQKSRDSMPDYRAEDDAKIETTLRAVYEWIQLDDKKRERWHKRAMHIGMQRIDSDNDDGLCTVAWAVRETAQKFLKLIGTRKRQKAKENIRKPREWAQLRYRVIVERGNKCECCGREPPDAVIHVDHIKPVAKYPHLALDPENLQVLCRECNGGKSAIDETDWRKEALPR